MAGSGGYRRQAGDASTREGVPSGLGVLQDYIDAHKWLNLAASRGDAAAAASAIPLAEKMIPEQVAQAQARARAWRPGESRIPASSEETTLAPAAPGCRTG